VTHISKSGILFGLSFIARDLALDNSLGDSSSVEKINSETPIEATTHLAIEDLLYYVIDNVVEEVVPREAEKEVLLRVRQDTGY
jgi:hypothetical protein